MQDLVYKKEAKTLFSHKNAINTDVYVVIRNEAWMEALEAVNACLKMYEMFKGYLLCWFPHKQVYLCIK